ncbi:SH3 domain-containing protein [Pseudorhodobacter sp. W20_MBD10_FR17]|uniref:SH3 domain-containing protein n=1 Tax=Pseudorhodobacter sp. W20_MBD10_FR17 TaxID=3240266 RepID=UPI003F9D4802
MRYAIFAALAAVTLGGLTACVPSDGRLDEYYAVAGVEANDMLKLRAGPGIGYRVILGVPNGTILRIYSCEQTGGTRWCKAALKTSSAVEGYVSWAYLREI